MGDVAREQDGEGRWMSRREGREGCWREGVCWRERGCWGQRVKERGVLKGRGGCWREGEGLLKGGGRMLKGMGVLMGRGMEKEWWASSLHVGDPSLSLLSLCVGASSSQILAVPSTCVVVSCHHCLDVSEGLEQVWDVTHQTGRTNDDQCHCSSFGCHIADGDMAPGFHMKCVWSIPSTSSCLGSLVAVGIHGQSVSLYLIVGIGHHVVVVVSHVVVLWLVVVDGRMEECHTLWH